MLRTRTKDITVLTDVASEPVTLQEAKDFLKVSYSDDDDIITGMITAARQLLEKQLNISFAPKSLQATFSLGDCSEYVIPYGPVTEVTEVKFRYEWDDTMNITTTKYTVEGQTFRGQEGYYTIKYDAGYANCPDAIRQGILKQVAWMYENRGDSTGAGQVNPDVLYMLSGYNQNSWI
ncbi:head-tail connector protein [Chitinophaga sp.]|uniref:head-tail connector protein n=1 Tax=Chitinophaga sp. TaxID=1869181 RepID=UPI0031D06687